MLQCRAEDWPARRPAKEHGGRGGGREGRAGPARELDWPARGKAGPAASKHREEEKG